MIFNTPIRIGCLYDSEVTKTIYDNLSSTTFTQFLTSLSIYTSFNYLPNTDLSEQSRSATLFSLTSLQDTLFDSLTSSLESYFLATSDNLSGSAFAAIFTGVLAVSGEDINSPSLFTAVSCQGNLKCYKY